MNGTQIIGCYLLALSAALSLTVWTVRRFTHRADLVDLHLTSFDEFRRSVRDCGDTQ